MYAFEACGAEFAANTGCGGKNAHHVDQCWFEHRPQLRVRASAIEDFQRAPKCLLRELSCSSMNFDVLVVDCGRVGAAAVWCSPWRL